MHDRARGRGNHLEKRVKNGRQIKKKNKSKNLVTANQKIAHSAADRRRKALYGAPKGVEARKNP